MKISGWWRIENNIIKDVRNIFRVKTEIDDTTIKHARNLFRVKKKQSPLRLKM